MQGIEGPVWTVVVAAGRGTRFGGPKQVAALGDRRVLDWSVAAARSVSDGIVLVLPEDQVGSTEAAVEAVVAGADSRSGSVRCGLAAVPETAAVVLVHDAARPLATPDLFHRVVAAVGDGADAAVPVVPVADSLRWRTGGTVDRDALVAVQTPQAFRAAALRAAHSRGAEATDDATLVEADGGRVVLVDGDPTNRKITEPADLVYAAAVIGQAGSTQSEVQWCR